MDKEDACAWCGTWFVIEGMNHNQKYCCEECGILAKREKARLFQRKKAASKAKAQSTQSDSVYDMVDVMMRLSKERGYSVQYGEVQTELLTGRLKIKDGAYNG